MVVAGTYSSGGTNMVSKCTIITGSYHESELQFVFGQPYLGLANTLRGPMDRAVASTIMGIMVSFAHTGYVNTAPLKITSDTSLIHVRPHGVGQ